MEKATFAAGCLWGIEAADRRGQGVVCAAVEYAGGHGENPPYEAACSETIGHAEAGAVECDPSQVCSEELLKLFWEIHGPTLLNRQGPDVGTQYRSAIFTAPFYRAEESHQRYLEGRGLARCHSRAAEAGPRSLFRCLPPDPGGWAAMYGPGPPPTLGG